MQALLLYGVPFSQPVRAVMWLMLYKRTPFEMVLINPGSKGETGSRNPAYLAKCQRRYPAESLAYLASAPLRREFDFDGAKVLMTHTGLGEDEYVYPGSPRLAAFAALPFDMVCFGHTHVPFVHRAGKVTVVNPGSCSQPRSPERRGTYALYDTRTRAATIHGVELG